MAFDTITNPTSHPTNPFGFIFLSLDCVHHNTKKFNSIRLRSICIANFKLGLSCPIPWGAIVFSSGQEIYFFLTQWQVRFKTKHLLIMCNCLITNQALRNLDNRVHWVTLINYGIQLVKVCANQIPVSGTLLMLFMYSIYCVGLFQ